MRRQLHIFLFLVFCATTTIVSAQKSAIYTHKNVTYNSALELFDKEKYSAAQDKFELVIQQSTNLTSETVINAKFYHALCALHLFNTDAENLFIEFINQHPESPKVKKAYFYLGTYQFRRKKYEKAQEWFNKIDPYDLNPEDLAEYHFKKGYSYFMREDYSTASNHFFEIKDIDTKYSATAKYYYAHIAYLQQKLESALGTFLQLSDHPKFAPIVPYYITQIYYLQNKYEKVLSYAPALLDTALPKRAAEIARVIGESYYQTKMFNEAIPYLKRYQKEKSYEATRQDYYQLGYAFYMSDSCNEAISWLKKSISEDDSLSQTAHYHLAECYLKTENKQLARSSFRAASNLDFDPQIKEDALFSFAKISYELSFHPFNDAIKAFEEFINTYPNSKKLSNAYEYLVAVYYTTKNYQAAINSLENINSLDEELQKAYQKIAYYRGIELFNNRSYLKAITYFNKSDKYLKNEVVKTDNNYWRSEALYRIKNYPDAIAGFKQYVFEPTAIASNNVNKAYYNIGYSYFKLKEYENAKTWFRKYIQTSEDDKRSKIKNDAYNRTGDCFFIGQDYKSAIEYYDKAAMLGKYQLDYSLYQSAVANGVLGKYDEKINLLETLINEKVKSHLMDDAIFELGETQLIKNKEDKALLNFQNITTNYKTSPYVSKSLVKQGLIYYNKKDDENALNIFKNVVAQFPNTNESKESLEKIKKIYIDKGDLTTYEQYLATVGGADEASQLLDADYYEVAENSYMNGNCEKATNEFSKYLEKYPKGNYQLNAYYYKATCEYKSGFVNEALLDFNQVINQPKNKFTESALLAAAQINTELGNSEEALKNYSQLEYLADDPNNIFKAQVEQMRLNFQLNNFDATIKYCELIINKDIDDANLITESHLIYAKSLLANDDYNQALKEFNTAANSKNEFGAEAMFNVANIHHLRGEFDQCETDVFSLIKNFGSYDYWMGKSLILLADNYVAKEDLFQAKVTLKSIIDNSKYPELVTTAKEKLSIIEKHENSRKAPAQEEEILELNFGEDLNIDKLFSNPEDIIDEEEIPTAKPTKKAEELKEETIIEKEDGDEE